MTLDPTTYRTILPSAGPALVLLALFSACAGDGKDTTGDTSATDTDTATDPTTDAAPTVRSSNPQDGATDIPINVGIRATFSEAMDRDSLDGAAFTVTFGASAAVVPGTVITAGDTAVFWPAGQLPSDTEFTATVTTAATSALGVALADDYVWTFTTGAIAAPGIGVGLGKAGEFAILAKSGVSTVPVSIVTGDVGVSPAAASSLTGFSLTADASNVFATSPQVTGRLYAADQAPPTPTNLTTAVGDMELAFTDASGRAPDVTELGDGAVGGLTLVPGVYRWGTGVSIATDLTLDGGPTDVWVFQIAENLTVAAGTSVVLTGGAVPENVFWQVSGATELGSTAHVEGVILCATGITLENGASVYGRLLAQTAVTLDFNTVLAPAR